MSDVYCLFRSSEFPERPGALRRFLEGIHAGWNISLFHYRNHGAGAYFGHLGMLCLVTDYSIRSLRHVDIGKVLAGIQVPPNDSQEFDKFLENLGYHYVEETHNPVVQMYLRN